MGKNVEYYLSKGMDEKMAAYYASGRKKLIAVEPKPDFSLILHFDNGETRLLDMRSTLKKGTVFEPFIQYENFKRVYVDDCNCVAWDIDPNINSDVVWNNKVDLCPDCCYVDSVPVK